MVDRVTAPVPGVRERRKQQTRAAIVSAAESLFASRGYDSVTVAEIAATAGISVKTLFTYFRSKEDLVFADQDTFFERVLGAVRDRAVGETPLDAITIALRSALEAEGGDNTADQGLEGFHRTVGAGEGAASRLRRMWEQYEDALARVLADDANEARPSPETRLAAAQLITMVRVITSQEVRDFVTSHKSAAGQQRALGQWINRAGGQLAGGLRQYGVRGG